MKPLVLTVLLLVSCSVPVAKPEPTQPPHFQAFANALCDRDAAYVSAHVAGDLSGTREQIAAALVRLPPCTSARYIGIDNGHPVFVLTENGRDAAYMFIFDGDLRVVSIR